MGRRGRDLIDLACERWAATKKELFGLTAPIRSSEYLGAVRCTLGQQRDLHAGSTSVGRVDQHWPEVFTGDALLVNRAYHAMGPDLKRVLEVHYLTRGRMTEKAARLDLPVQRYSKRLELARSRVAAVFAQEAAYRAPAHDLSLA